MMKNINIIAGLMMGTLVLFSACDSDRDDNPTLQTPNTFTLNTPAYAAANIDLSASDSLNFTWSQPDYGFPAAAEYQMEVSTTNKWTVSVDEASNDETGTLKANYALMGDPTGTCSTNIGSAALAKALEQLEKWSENAVPATQNVYARAYSVLNGDTIYSNVVTMTVVPYFVQLANAAPNYWYLIGACIGDGKWTNTALGTSIMPLYPIAGQTYDKKTGDGILSWTGYLTTDGFKLIHAMGSWTEQIGSSDGTPEKIVFNDGGSKNICVPSNGIYTVTMNTTKSTLTVEKYTGTVTDNSQMIITGDFNSWAVTTTMSAFSTYDKAKNHDWVYDITIASDGGVKFTSDSSWKTNWGAADFPYGTGTQGGANISAKAGSYKVFFNDITGQYNFISK